LCASSAKPQIEPYFDLLKIECYALGTRERHGGGDLFGSEFPVHAAPFTGSIERGAGLRASQTRAD
jgi:hypothetical protein